MADDLFEFYVGGYARPGQNSILRCALDTAAGRIAVRVACDALNNPSWLLRNPEKPLLYAVEELAPEGRLAVLAVEDGGLRLLKTVPTGGANPCHIAMAPGGQHLLVANYGGSLAVFGLDADGLPARMSDFRRHDPAGLRVGNPVRQDAPHVHFSLCDGSRVYVNDLGLNRVFVYGWDARCGRLIDTGDGIDFPPCAGPRHLALSGNGDRLYVLCELNATLCAFARDADGAWQLLQVVSVVPEGFADFEKCRWEVGAAIRFANAHTLCVSARGADVLAVFRVDRNGRLTDRRIIPSGGRTPRDFLPAGGYILVANQDSDVVCLLKQGPDGYALTGIRLHAIRPACIIPA